VCVDSTNNVHSIQPKPYSEARRLVQEARAQAEAALSQEKELKRQAESEAQSIIAKARKEAEKLLASAPAQEGLTE